MIKRFLIFVSIFIISTTANWAINYKISGRVVDAKTNEPLIGVNILIAQTKLGTVTDINGKFELNNLKEGKYDIRFSYLGYSTIIKEINLPSEEANNLEIKLNETSIDLSEVIVTGNPFLVETKNLSQSSISLSKLDLIIKNNGTIADALNYQPGVAMRSNGVATGRPVIRGFSNNKVLILEDGLRMGDLSNASDDHAVSDDGSDAEKIEVIEGPSSLLYGSNAVGGVVNIITDAIPSTVENGLNGEIFLQGASVNNEYLGNAHLNYGWNNIEAHCKLFKRKADDYKIPGDKKTFNSDLNSEGMLFGVSYLPDWGGLGLSYDDFNDKYGLPTTPDAEEIVYIDMHKKQYKFNTDVNKINSFLTSMSLKAGYLDYAHKEISRIDGIVGTSFGMKTLSTDLSFTHEPLMHDLNGIIGFYGTYQKYDVEGEEALTSNAKYNSLAGYFFEKYNLAKFSLSFGARYELNNIKFPQSVLTDSSFVSGESNFNSLSYSLGVIYNLTNNTSVFINLANAFRAPTIEELSSYAVHEALASFDIGNRNLQKENTTGIDIGVRSQNENYYFELTGYYNKVNDLIFRSPSNLFYSKENGFNNSDEGFRVYKYLQANANVYGFETKLSFELLRGFTTTLISDYVGAKNTTTDENLPLIPPFRFSTEFRYATSKFWTGCNINLVATQNDVAPNEEPTAGYGLLGVYAGLKLLSGNFAHIINFKINNLFDKAHKDHLSAIKDFTYMPGRSIIINYRFVF
jgi:iron complex outermembrane receptor protein